MSTDARLVDEAVEAIRAGKPVVLPTDTVYGLCATPYKSEPVLRMYALKGRDEQRFSELVARRAQREPLAYVLGEWGFRG